ncbi:uncharacterized protein BXIN_1283 [Babesia sp. Xinjiang]|uniref:uncharacterized protein n=1 Tax=Babesia sp. Xinjiang TaxID=462227 RepID=UPI000A2633D6|nr:uncharacterized protein BXIN_1283 [Babesia sp. Xinjiang]ORM39926.1 hypothetical protein BXIN_1283 [Babesia sp. Xinjiang]
MAETLGIGSPLRSRFIAALWRSIGGTLRLKTSKGVTIDTKRLTNALKENKNNEVEPLVTKHLKADVRLIMFAGTNDQDGNGMQSVEGMCFSLIRVTISYNSEDAYINIVPTEATQFPPCPAGVTAWEHFATYADGLGYGSLRFDENCKPQVAKLIQPYCFNEANARTSRLPPAEPLDAILYVLWHWVSASYTVEFGVPLASPHGTNKKQLDYDFVKKYFGHLLMPRTRHFIDGPLMEYLKSDDMALPPEIQQIGYERLQSDSDLDSYASDKESEDAESLAFDWSAVQPFVFNVTQMIQKYQSVLPSVNGIYFDDALWVTNCNVECTSTREVILLMKSSTYWHDVVDKEGYLTLYPGIYFAGRHQLRCFILEYELVCVEQLFVHENFGFIAKDAQPLVEALKEFSARVIDVLLKLGVSRVIFDVTISTQNTDPHIVDIYAFGALNDELIQLEDVYHFYYTKVKDGIQPNDKVDLEVVSGVLVAFVGPNASRLRKHAWCPKDVGNLNFNTPDDLIDYLRFQTSKCS